MARRRLVALLFMFSLFFFSDSASATTGKVSLALYYETLCPYSANFIVNYLANIFDSGLIDIVDLNLVPYGNARIGSNNSIACQHGPYECLLNTVEACAINVWPDLNKHFTFIYCVESLVVLRKYTEWESCFEKTGFDSQPVVDCYNSGTGKEISKPRIRKRTLRITKESTSRIIQRIISHRRDLFLELQYAAETNALEPPHTYVPWVVVNGQPLYEDYENFETYICKAYTGTLTTACKSLPVQLKPEKRNLLGRVCHGKDVRSLSTT
eukprot:TRINITY_DN2964_c0_g1_i6.p1 TRINITY_DN2964_c0_g1~~TRINITY_DN2964_c0_g1_i6.p1  ORF type:complete len:268 (-),score=11.27 TRINITY_DN2964_c0_g1_i6:268-1071(-)